MIAHLKKFLILKFLVVTASNFLLLTLDPKVWVMDANPASTSAACSRAQDSSSGRVNAAIIHCVFSPRPQRVKGANWRAAQRFLHVGLRPSKSRPGAWKISVEKYFRERGQDLRRALVFHKNKYCQLPVMKELQNNAH